LATHHPHLTWRLFEPPPASADLTWLRCCPQVEADVLFRALRDFNVPKILLQDMVIFMGLLNDLFPGTDPPRKRDEKMEVVIKKMAEDMNLMPDDDFVLRVVQVRV